MARTVRKVVFPVAGLGTRVLPATKAMPKEMLPVVDRPLIQHAVDEAREAGITTFIFVVAPRRTIILDHFSVAPVLERVLKARRKAEELRVVRETTLPKSRIRRAVQSKPLGLGHAVWCARNHVGNDPFAVILVDDLIQSTPGCLSGMMEAYREVGGNLIAVEDVPRALVSRYGVLDVESEKGRLAKARGIVEKPKPEEAPSTLTVVGRYILQPQIFKHLARGQRGAGGEIQLTDGIAATLGEVPLHGYRFAGRRFDCGNKIGLIAANVAYGLARDDLREGLRAAIGALE